MVSKFHAAMDLLAVAADFATDMRNPPPDDAALVADASNEDDFVEVEANEDEDVYKELQVLTVPAEIKKYMREKKILPLYFMKLTYNDAWKHLLCKDPNKPTVVTHLLMVPLEEYDETYEPHLLCLDKEVNVHQLRKICSKFGRKSPRLRDHCRTAINEIKKEPQQVERLRAIDLSVSRNTDILNRTRLVFRMVSNLFGDEHIRNKFSIFNKKLKRPEFEGRFVETFYSDLRSAINNDSLPRNKVLLPCPDAMFLESYDHYLSEDALGLQHPQNTVIPIDANNKTLIPDWINILLKMREVMIANLTKSGNHDSDAFQFTTVAFRNVRKTKFISQHALYYFFIHAKANPDIMERFSRSLPSGIAGGNSLDDEVVVTTKKKKATQYEDVMVLIQKGFEEDYARRDAISSRKDAMVQAELSYRKREDCIADMKRSIDTLQKQQFKYFNMIEKCTNEEIIHRMMDIVKSIACKIESYEFKLSTLEKDRFESIVNGPRDISIETPTITTTNQVASTGHVHQVMETPFIMATNPRPSTTNHYSQVEGVSLTSSVPQRSNLLQATETPLVTLTNLPPSTTNHFSQVGRVSLSSSVLDHSALLQPTNTPLLTIPTNSAEGVTVDRAAAKEVSTENWSPQNHVDLFAPSRFGLETFAFQNRTVTDNSARINALKRRAVHRRGLSSKNRAANQLVSNKRDDESDDSWSEDEFQQPFKMMRRPVEPNYEDDSQPIVYGPQF